MTNSELSVFPLIEIRKRRSTLQVQEDAVSFVRRMAQGRLDMATDEQRRRADHVNLFLSNRKSLQSRVVSQRPCILAKRGPSRSKCVRQLCNGKDFLVVQLPPVFFTDIW